jgi:hypothetical protein
MSNGAGRLWDAVTGVHTMCISISARTVSYQPGAGMCIPQYRTPVSPPEYEFTALANSLPTWVYNSCFGCQVHAPH